MVIYSILISLTLGTKFLYLSHTYVNDDLLPLLLNTIFTIRNSNSVINLSFKGKYLIVIVL